MDPLAIIQTEGDCWQCLLHASLTGTRNDKSIFSLIWITLFKNMSLQESIPLNVILVYVLTLLYKEKNLIQLQNLL